MSGRDRSAARQGAALHRIRVAWLTANLVEQLLGGGNALGRPCSKSSRMVSSREGKGAVLLPVVSVLMMAVGLLAAVEPAQRGLRIEPTEALRDQ